MLGKDEDIPAQAGRRGGGSMRGLRAGIRDVAQGLWIWSVKPPGWPTGLTSTCVASGGERVLIDPSAPDDTDPLWRRLDADPPTILAVLKPEHVRDVDLFARRYGAKAYGPGVFHRDDIPKTEFEPIEPGSEIPGGLRALYDGRGRNETPLWIPSHRTLVFADALTGQTGELRVWSSPSHEERALPALRNLLALPFERVIVAHGQPLHGRADYERALALPPGGIEES